MRSNGTPPLRLVEALADVGRERLLDRKLVVAPTFGAGRELLRRLAREERGWVGFEIATPRRLALRLARGAMVKGGLRPMDAFDEQALLDKAVDGALRTRAGTSLRELGEGVGFRESVHGAVTALRLAGLGPSEVRRAPFLDPERRAFLVRTVERYEVLLEEGRRADAATVLRLALAVLESEGPVLHGETVLLVPGLGTRGLAGRFVQGLMAGGARLLATDPVVGGPEPEGMVWRAAEPSTDLAFLRSPEDAPGPARDEPAVYHASSITEELREVARRAMAMGLAWDDVEIVTPDPAAYGSALHALAMRLGIPVTYAVGLPVERTRPGRAAQAYLEWIENGFQADAIRRLLEAGDLRAPRGRGDHAPAALARRFRSLRVGWGRRRYRQQIQEALQSLDGMEQGYWESEEGFQRRLRRTREELEALRSILFPALKATPSVPDRSGQGGSPVSASELARGLKAFLRRVPPGRGPDAAARDEIFRVLDRVDATLRRRTGFDAALTILRGHLKIRVRAPDPRAAGPDDAGAPWRSEGGHLHLADIEHGGFSGRKATFLVGFDAERIPGNGAQDPVLPDQARRALGPDLPTSAHIVAERAFRLAAMMSRLRGRVTLSYSAWDASAARSVAPSPVLLQALRLARRDATLTFASLHQALGPVVSAVPRSGLPSLDSDDVWMGALASKRVLRAGEDAVMKSFPRLALGRSASRERAEGQPGPHHGVVTPRPDLLDPRGNPEVVLSASRLEDLGACPRRYLLKSVLRLYPPDDPELDPDSWLDPLARGRLLHSVYERSLREARARNVKPRDAEFEALALEILADGAKRLRQEVPAPGDGVLARELAALDEDVRSFARMLREHGAEWIKLEMKFGRVPDEALALDLPEGPLSLRGAVDRVDEDLRGLHVIDYKTGVARDYEGDTGTFRGGRRLQHAVYAEAAERLLRRNVVTGEYHFPTRRGENRIVPFDRLRLAGIVDLLGHLLNGVAAGAFVPTDDENDCRFCDYRSVCNVRTDAWGKSTSPLAAWSKDHLSVGLQPAFQHLRAARKFED